MGMAKITALCVSTKRQEPKREVPEAVFIPGEWKGTLTGE